MLRIAPLIIFAVFMFALGISGGRMITAPSDQTKVQSAESIEAEGLATAASDPNEPAYSEHRTFEGAFAAAPSQLADNPFADPSLTDPSLTEWADPSVAERADSSTGTASADDLSQEIASQQSKTVFLSSLSQAIGDSDIAATTAKSPDYSITTNPRPNPQLRSLIIEMMPGASEQQVSAWVEQLSDLNLEAATFILQQRKRSMGHDQPMPELAATLNTPVDDLLSGAVSGFSVASIQQVAHPEAPSSIAGQAATDSNLMAAAEIVRSNLIGAHVPGHRATLVLLEAKSGEPVVADGSGRTESGFRTRIQFDPGRTVKTGRALDVALPPDPQVMFRLLDGSVLTRRGDFEILSDGQIGLKLNGVELAVYHSPVIQHNVCNVRITGNGDIFGDVMPDLDQPVHADLATADAALQPELSTEQTSDRQQLLGTISVCRVRHLDQLTSQDGLLFRLPTFDSALKQPIHTSDAKVQLAEGCLELSNADINQQRAVLDNLEQLQSTNLR